MLGASCILKHVCPKLKPYHDSIWRIEIKRLSQVFEFWQNLCHQRSLLSKIEPNLCLWKRLLFAPAILSHRNSFITMNKGLYRGLLVDMSKSTEEKEFLWPIVTISRRHWSSSSAVAIWTSFAHLERLCDPRHHLQGGSLRNS